MTGSAFESIDDARFVSGTKRFAKTRWPPGRPTAIVKDLDPVIERVIDRCLQKDPAARPASALQVAAALPGADPIAAALAAGETPPDYRWRNIWSDAIC